MIYCPPSPLCDFFDDMDALLSCSPDDGTPLFVLGDFNIPPSPEFIDFSSTFEHTLSPYPPTHQARNQLDLVFTRSCSISALSIAPLTVSEHHAVTFSLPLKFPHPCPSHGHHPPQSEIPLSFCSLLLFFPDNHPQTNSLKCLLKKRPPLCYPPLSSSLDVLCPLTFRPARSSPSPPWLSESREPIDRCYEQQTDNGENHIILMTLLTTTTSCMSSPQLYQQPNVAFYLSKINYSASNARKLFSLLSSLLTPPAPAPPSSLTADDFVTYLTKQVKTSCPQYYAHPESTSSDPHL